MVHLLEGNCVCMFGKVYDSFCAKYIVEHLPRKSVDVCCLQAQRPIRCINPATVFVKLAVHIMETETIFIGHKRTLGLFWVVRLLFIHGFFETSGRYRGGGVGGVRPPPPPPPQT